MSFDTLRPALFARERQPPRETDNKNVCSRRLPTLLLLLLLLPLKVDQRRRVLQHNSELMPVHRFIVHVRIVRHHSVSSLHVRVIVD